MSPIREFELKGHLKGNPDNVINDSSRDSSKLAQSDFQLYEALEVLKTMAMLDGKAPADIAKDTHLLGTR
jgi:hypothetical protein